MKSFLIFCFLLSIISWAQGRSREFYLGRVFEKENSAPLEDDGYTTKWFTQILDHSDPTNHNTWQQKYLVNEQYFNETERSVVFLQIGEESPLYTKDIIKTAWIEYAQQFNALAILVEHRFYGASQPTGNATLESYKFHTSEQALADYANIIQSLNSTFKNPPQWIVFGGSYAGSLAAWMRLKYPHLVKGAVSSSAPLIAKIDFYEYFQVVAQDLKDISNTCHDAVKEGFTEMEKLLVSSAGRNNLTTLFNLCSPLDDSKKNVSKFIDRMITNFADMAQYNDWGKTKEYTSFTIESVCDIMTNSTRNKNPLGRLADLNKVMLELYRKECVEVNYDKMIASLKNTTDTSNSDRAWLFQTCNEFGWYQSTHKADIFFSTNTVGWWIQQCKDIFGSTFNETNLESNMFRTNTIYGGLSDVTENLVYVHGSHDPWHKLGITESNNVRAPAIFISGTTHCDDMHASAPNDLPQLTEARKQIRSLIKQWLQQNIN